MSAIINKRAVNAFLNLRAKELGTTRAKLPTLKQAVAHATEAAVLALTEYLSPFNEDARKTRHRAPKADKEQLQIPLE